MRESRKCKQDKGSSPNWEVAEFNSRVGNPVKADEIQNKLREPAIEENGFDGLAIRSRIGRSRSFKPDHEQGSEAKKNRPRRKWNIACAGKQAC